MYLLPILIFNRPLNITSKFLHNKTPSIAVHSSGASTCWTRIDEIIDAHSNINLKKKSKWQRGKIVDKHECHQPCPSQLHFLPDVVTEKKVLKKHLILVAMEQTYYHTKQPCSGVPTIFSK